MIFRQFCASDRQLSYLFADPVTRQAAIVDAHLELEDQYLGVIQRLDLKLSFLVDTHVHESHRSAAPVLSKESESQWIVPYTAMNCDQARAADNREKLYIGEEFFFGLHTPGHSPCSTCFCWNDHVFTGHTLLCGGAGPCNRPDSDAGQLYDSIIGQLYTLPGEMAVHPGYDWKSRESTISVERSGNRELQSDTPRRHFVTLKERGVRQPEWPLLRPAAAPDTGEQG